MKNVFQSKKSFLVAGLLIVAVAFGGWQLPGQEQKNTTGNYQRSADTIKPGERSNDTDEFRMKEFEKSMEAFDKQMEQLDRQMEHLDIQLKNLDINLGKKIEEALAKVDFEKIGKDVEESIARVNWEKIEVDMDKSLQLAKEKMQEIDLKKMKDEMKKIEEKFKSEEFKQQFNSEKFHKQIDDAMSKANEGIQKAKQKLQQIKTFTNELEKDKLIDKKKGFKIEWKENGDLYINGNKQPKDITDKYRKYFEEGGYEIKINGEETDTF